MGFLAKLTPARLRGNKGEAAAERFLAKRGFRVLARNWRHRQWELDLICQDRDTIVFVEVKTRKAGGMGIPADGLTKAKQTRLVKAASQYLTREKLWDNPCRFDLVGVVDADGDLTVEHTENAFDLTDLHLGL